MLETVRDILAADTFCYTISIILAVLSGVIISSATSSFGMGALYTPGIAFGGLAGIYAFREMGILLTRDHYADVVISAGAGTLAGLIAMMILTRLVYAATGIRKPVRVETRSFYRY
jgi:hypothetical protein